MCLMQEIHFICGHNINSYELCVQGFNEPTWNNEACTNYRLNRMTSEQQCGSGGFFCQQVSNGNLTEEIIRTLQQANQHARKMEEYYDTKLGEAKAMQILLRAYFEGDPDQEHLPENQAVLQLFGAIVFSACNDKQIYNSAVCQSERELATAELCFTQTVPAALARGEEIPDLVMPYTVPRLLPADSQSGRAAQQATMNEHPPQQNSVANKSTRSSSKIKDQLHESTSTKKSSNLASPTIHVTLKRETLPASTLIDYPAVANLSVDTDTGDRSSAINAITSAELEKIRNSVYIETGYMHDPATPVKAKRVMRRADYETKVKTGSESTTSIKIEVTPAPAARPQRTTKKNINYDETNLSEVMDERAAKGSGSSPALQKASRLGKKRHSLIVKLKNEALVARESLEASKTDASSFTGDNLDSVPTPLAARLNTVYNDLAAPMFFSIPAASQIFGPESSEGSYYSNSPVRVSGSPSLLPSIEIHSKANLNVMFSQPFQRETSTFSELGFHHIKRRCTPEEDATFNFKRARFDLDMEDEIMDSEDDTCLSLD